MMVKTTFSSPDAICFGCRIDGTKISRPQTGLKYYNIWRASRLVCQMIPGLFVVDLVLNPISDKKKYGR